MTHVIVKPANYSVSCFFWNVTKKIHNSGTHLPDRLKLIQLWGSIRFRSIKNEIMLTGDHSIRQSFADSRTVRNSTSWDLNLGTDTTWDFNLDKQHCTNTCTLRSQDYTRLLRERNRQTDGHFLKFLVWLIFTSKIWDDPTRVSRNIKTYSVPGMRIC